MTNPTPKERAELALPCVEPRYCIGPHMYCPARYREAVARAIEAAVQAERERWAQDAVQREVDMIRDGLRPQEPTP